MQQLGVSIEFCSAGRVTLVAANACAGAESLASLSELALALSYTSVTHDAASQPLLELRIAFFALRTHWNGPVRAFAEARRCGTSWLLDCEIRDRHAQLLSTAFGHASG